jgi:hypothetical protein
MQKTCAPAQVFLRVGLAAEIAWGEIGERHLSGVRWGAEKDMLRRARIAGAEAQDHFGAFSARLNRLQKNSECVAKGRYLGDAKPSTNPCK